MKKQLKKIKLRKFVENHFKSNEQGLVLINKLSFIQHKKQRTSIIQGLDSRKTHLFMHVVNHILFTIDGMAIWEWIKWHNIMFCLSFFLSLPFFVLFCFILLETTECLDRQISGYFAYFEFFSLIGWSKLAVDELSNSFLYKAIIQKLCNTFSRNIYRCFHISCLESLKDFLFSKNLHFFLI